jgi:hypothetical protein
VQPSLHHFIIPESKIKSIELPISNIIGSYESRKNLISQRGPNGIVSSVHSESLGAPIPILEEEKQHLQQSFNRAYGMRNGQSSIILSNTALNFQKTGFNVEELGLHKEVTESAKAICDVMNYPPHLLGLIDPTFNNQETAAKSVYTSGIIPSAKNIAEQFGSYFLSANETLFFDYSHLPEMQIDKVKEYDAALKLSNDLQIQFRNNIITENEFRLAKGWQPKENGERYYSEIGNLLKINTNELIQTQNGTNNQNTNN